MLFANLAGLQLLRAQGRGRARRLCKWSAPKAGVRLHMIGSFAKINPLASGGG